MGKRLFQTIAATALVISIASTPVLAGAGHAVNLDGKQIILENDVISENGYNLVPLREILDALGATVDWQSESGTLRAEKGGNKIVLTIGSREAFVNGAPMTLDVAPVLKNGTAYVPIAFLARGLGYIVDWDWETKVVVLKSTGVETDRIEVGYTSTYAETLSYDDAVATAISKNSDLRKLKMDMENTRNTRKDLVGNYELTLTDYQMYPNLEYDQAYLSLLNTLDSLQKTLDNKPYYTETLEGIVELQVRSSFMLIEKAQNQIGITEAQIELAQRALKNQKLMYDLGMVSKVSVEEAELSLEQAQQSLEMNKRALEAEYVALNSLLQYDTDRRYNVVYPLNYQPLAANFDLNSYISTMRNESPNIKLLETAVDTAEADKKLTKFKTSKNNTEKEIAESAVDKASLDVQDARNALEKNLQSTYISMRDIEGNIRNLQIELEKAQIQADVARVQYEAGTITELQLLQALYAVDELSHNINLLKDQYDLTLFTFNRPYLLGGSSGQN